MPLDIPLARKVLEFAEQEHADFRHDQNIFYGKFEVGDYVGEDYAVSDENFCGTAACLAGITCMLSPEVEHVGDDVTYQGVPDHSHAYVARKVLGLTDIQAGALFYDYDNASALNRLRRYIDSAERQLAKPGEFMIKSA